MTPEEMSPEEMNVAIAEACGWKQIGQRTFPAPRSFQGVITQLIGISPKGVKDNIPPFSTSLDAMATAEATLTVSQQAEYEMQIRTAVAEEIGLDWDGFDCVPEFRLITATARQRAVAFLSVKGKLP